MGLLPKTIKFDVSKMTSGIMENKSGDVTLLKPFFYCTVLVQDTNAIPERAISPWVVLASGFVDSDTFQPGKILTIYDNPFGNRKSGYSKIKILENFRIDFKAYDEKVFFIDDEGNEVKAEKKDFDSKEARILQNHIDGFLIINSMGVCLLDIFVKTVQK